MGKVSPVTHLSPPSVIRGRLLEDGMAVATWCFLPGHLPYQVFRENTWQRKRLEQGLLSMGIFLVLTNKKMNSCVVLGNLHNHSETQFPHQSVGNMLTAPVLAVVLKV